MYDAVVLRTVGVGIPIHRGEEGGVEEWEVGGGGGG